MEFNGAGERIWTADILITNQTLYQLSYTGSNAASEEKAAASENTTKSNYFVQADRLQIKTNSLDASR